ncbi:MAG: organomercurial lyase [Micromonosporaceae bacterium]
MEETTSSPPGLDLERLVEVRLNEFREVPGLLEWQLPIGAALFRLVAEARPLTAAEIASVLRLPVGEVSPRFDGLLQELGVVRDKDGNVTIAAMSPQGTQLPIFRFAWRDTGKVAEIPGCSGDMLLPVLAARRPARIDLPCPATGRTISVEVGSAGEVERVDPADAVAIMESLDSESHPRDWVRSDCAAGLFFASAEAASEWLAEHPGYLAVPMALFFRTETQIFTRALAEGDRLRS